MNDDFSAEYLNGVQRDEKDAAVAWLMGRTGGSQPSPAPGTMAAPVPDDQAELEDQAEPGDQTEPDNQAGPGDQAEALMAESLQAGAERGADFDPLKASREAVYGPGSEGVRGASRAIARDVSELPRAIAHGGIEGVNQSIQTVHELGEWVEGNLPDWLESLGAYYGYDFNSFDAWDGGFHLSKPDSKMSAGRDWRKIGEAVKAVGSVAVDLDAAFPLVADNALWDGLVDLVRTDSAEDVRAREADLAALDLPPAILERAGADVTPESRADLVKRLRAAGRSEAQAKRDMEILARFASIRGRITGEDPNRMLKEVFRFGRAGKEAAGGLHQAELAAETRRKFDESPTAEARGDEIFPFAEPLPNLAGIRKKLTAWLREKGWLTKFKNDDTGWDNISVSGSSIRDTTYHGAGPAKARVLAVLPEMIKNGIYLEPGKPGVKGHKRYVFASKVKIGTEIEDKSYVVGFVVEEDNNGRRFYNHELTEIENLGPLGSPVTEVTEVTGGGPEANRDSIMSIVKKHLGVKPGLTLEQPAYTGGPTRGITRMSTEFIGTGEDTLNEGWGLYSSSLKEIAEWYRNALTNLNVRREGVSYQVKKYSLSGTNEWTRSDGQPLNPTEKKALQLFDMLRDKEKAASVATSKEVADFLKGMETEGQVYKLDIPENDELLRWESELSEQPEKVKEALRRGADSMPDDEAQASMAEVLYEHLENPEGVTGKQLYEDLAMFGDLAGYEETGEATTEGKRAASEWLNSLGVPGLRYLSGEFAEKGDINSPHNFVIWNDQAINILETYYQAQANEAGPRGRMEFLEDGTINIIFSQSQDASTAVHEFAHAFRKLVADLMALPPDQIADQAAFESLKEGWAAAEAWLARFDDEATLKAAYDKYQKADFFSGRDFADLTPEEKERVKERARHEYFARGFEAYLLEGTAPTTGLKKLFKTMKEWLTKLYHEARNLDVELNDEVRDFFDRLLATEEELMVESWRGEMALTPEDLEAMRESGAVDSADLERALAAGDMARAERDKQITAARLKEHAKMRRLWWREAWAAAREHPTQERLNEIIKGGGISLSSLKRGGYSDADTIRALTKIRPGLVSDKATTGFDEWSEMFGFENSGEFIDNLLNTPNPRALAEAYVAEQEAEWSEYFELEAGLTEAELNAWEEELKLWAKFMGEEYRPGSVQALRAAVKAQADAASIDELIRLNQKEWKDKLKAVQKEAKASARAAGREAGKAARDARKAADIFGEAFFTFQGRPAEAIEHLLREKRGHVPGAFYREELGNIDLPWGKAGKKGFGLAHIIERRNGAGYDGEAFARSLPRIIQEGRVEQRPGYQDRAYIVHEKSEAVIRLDWDGNARTWLLTAYPTDKKSGPSSSGRRSDLARMDAGEKTPSPDSKDRTFNIDELFEKDKNLDRLQDEFQRGVNEGYNWGVAEATLASRMAEGREKARLLLKRQEMALRYKEQTERAREIAKFEAQARRLIKQKVATAYRKGGIRPDFHMQMKNILAAAGLGRPVEAGESLADFVARLAADGAPVDIAPGIVSGLIWEKPGKNGQVRRRTYRSLKYLEFSDLKDAIDNLAHMGRRRKVGGIMGSRGPRPLGAGVNGPRR